MGAPAVQGDVRVGSVVSEDGTVIGYRSTGTGPALLIVPGALQMAADFDGLAAALADRFTVHTVERRGRGASGPQGDAYSAVAEVADIEAVRAATGARLVFGTSFGGFLTLQAALNGSAFDRIAVYEPGVAVDGSVPMGWADRSRRELEAGKPAEAFLTFVQGINPDLSGKAPRWLMRIILKFAVKGPEREQKHVLLAGSIREHEESVRTEADFPRYAEVAAPVLLMAGKDLTTTGAGRATVRLKDVLPDAELVTYPKLDHFGPEAKPEAVAADIARFLQAHSA
ncbi:alpha/beta fold hydrolase [Yinghuangia soli]|uniref:Alpha/beta hydrolase n=1 Tax=Yinghuangia soli TaxID=2908204 RepID=A0AA41Q6E8_9ACTN|nr:alpha/beta hydrolase [Yinghuangia soli]MCF2532072.1 alpha/beta hydrolase [Yinghuangia soli]